MDCGDLDDPAFGSVRLSGTSVGSIAGYSCSVGYQLDGGATRVCQPNGEWSGSAPICRRMHLFFKYIQFALNSYLEHHYYSWYIYMIGIHWTVAHTEARCSLPTMAS